MGPISRIDYAKAGLPRAIATMRMLVRDRIEDRLPHIQAPTLVVRPQRDHLVPEAWTDRVDELIPDSQLVTLSRASHSIRPRTAARLSTLLLRFLSDGDDGLEPEEERESDARKVESFSGTLAPAPR